MTSMNKVIGSKGTSEAKEWSLPAVHYQHHFLSFGRPLYCTYPLMPKLCGQNFCGRLLISETENIKSSKNQGTYSSDCTILSV